MLASGSSMELRSSGTLPPRDLVCTIQPFELRIWRRKFVWAGRKQNETEVSLWGWFLLSGMELSCLKVDLNLQLCIFSLKIWSHWHLQRPQKIGGRGNHNLNPGWAERLQKRVSCLLSFCFVKKPKTNRGRLCSGWQLCFLSYQPTPRTRVKNQWVNHGT